MSEDRAPVGPRSNPLYGGPGPSTGTNAGGRTPSWARRSAPSPRHSVFSDVASTPPDSPARDHLGPPYTTPDFEYPGYTVETPGHSEATGASPYPHSPYHAPPYYVQTPAQSDPGNTSPFSSAPSSPAHPYYASDSDTRSQRSARIGSRPSRLSQQTFSKIDEEDEEYQDPERDRQRREKAITCTVWSFIFVLVLIIGIGGLIVWEIFEPKAPEYKFVGVSMESFAVYSSSFDSHGVSTASVYGNMTASFSAHNPNEHFDVEYENAYIALGYSNLPIFSGEIKSFDQRRGATSNFTGSAAGWNQPLYGAGPALEDDLVETFVNLTLRAQFRSHVTVFWKIVQPKFYKELSCTVGLNSTTLQVLNNTCAKGFR